MFNIFKFTGTKRPADGGKLQLTLTPSNPQQGQIAMCRTITAAQWEAIKHILDGKEST